MAGLVAETFLVDPRPAYPLRILATRYSSSSHAHTESNDGLTLIFLHATGMHKESWEVVIKRLFELRSQSTQQSKIRDIFSIESPNHGESAVINEDALKEHYQNNWPTREYARAAYIFLSAGTTAGAKVDFSKRHLVGIGHSIGAPALFLMRDFQPLIQFESIIGIEPGISVKDNPETNVASQALTTWTWLRRDVWRTPKAAKRELEASPMYMTWDPRALDLYVRYGLRTHPAAKFKPPFNFQGVTTALTKEQEAASYRSDELVVQGLEAYGAVTRQIPVHLIWGSINDIATPELEALLEDTKAGRTPASVAHIDNAGHLVVQQQPEQVAEVIHSILVNHPSSKPRL